MKQSDIITTVLVAALGIAVAAWGCNALLGDPASLSVSFKTVEVISDELATPDENIFNKQAVNPTVEVYVGLCEDVDQSGDLDESEKLACNEVAVQDDTGNEDEGEEGVNDELSGEDED